MTCIDRKLVYAHPTLVEPMLDYIVTDFEKSRGALNDASIGGMVICDSAEQARQLFELFNAKYAKATIPAREEAANNADFPLLLTQPLNTVRPDLVEGLSSSGFDRALLSDAEGLSPNGIPVMNRAGLKNAAEASGL